MKKKVIKKTIKKSDLITVLIVFSLSMIFGGSLYLELENSIVKAMYKQSKRR